MNKGLLTCDWLAPRTEVYINGTMMTVTLEKDRVPFTDTRRFGLTIQKKNEGREQDIHGLRRVSHQF